MRLILLLLVTVIFSSCDKLGLGFTADSESTEVNVEAEQEFKLTSMAILLTNVDQLRLRRYPDVKSEMLTTFDENTPIYFTGEATDFEEVIGKEKGPWKRVITVDG